ncbi:TadE/TadG family type IV pilus assembly protein [Brevundimonas sp. AAP58]|uniref:TadE/TadG family type IV pilus assembly protein n=1 Tax=Brevundimonas sp. AAP58 TaxID=1523422 RepID=UPI001E2DD9F1|nr:TadE/TadG family type IV pilus assembly protein [Brevundimonas sp. AAP58]
MEFAIVAVPFFFVIFAVLELGVIFLVDSTLEAAVQQASRLVRTGQAQGGVFSAAQFRTAMCQSMNVFEGDCMTRSVVDVRPIPQFRDPNPPDPIVDGQFVPAQTGFDPGAAGDLMLVRVWYQQPVVTPLLSRGLTRLESGDALISVTTAFRNEPF